MMSQYNFPYINNIIMIKKMLMDQLSKTLDKIVSRFFLLFLISAVFEPILLQH